MIEVDGPMKLVRVQRCTNIGCEADADVVVAPQIALCGTHGLEWYNRERVDR